MREFLQMARRLAPSCGTARERIVLSAWHALAIAALSLCVFLLLRPLLYPGSGDEHHGQAVMLAITALVIETVSTVSAHRQIKAREQLISTAHEARVRTDELFAMTDMLQSADCHEDAAAVLMTSSQRLLPDFGSALYVFNNSRDRLDLIQRWNIADSNILPESVSPSNCWALKRGKFHINDPQSITLCCGHHHDRGFSTIEIPMMARGSVYGLLVFALEAPDAFERLRAIQRLGRALADSMSLALSNIALREKLRTQSLRDPLTGLYNRRYMEDALERYVSLSERTGSLTSVIMVDLDHFKGLNDEHGHAKGDAVLRDVAAQLVGGVRPSDVVCRYGGEELVVILPNCNLEDARMRAEALRARIEGLSEVHAAQISASFGVATIPETAASHTDIVAIADAALYRAKQQGRNRVVCAQRKAEREEFQPRLAETA